MSELQKAVKSRSAEINRRAADLVRRGTPPWEAMRLAAQEVDDDATQEATGYRRRRVIPMTVER